MQNRRSLVFIISLSLSLVRSILLHFSRDRSSPFFSPPSLHTPSPSFPSLLFSLRTLPFLLLASSVIRPSRSVSSSPTFFHLSRRLLTAAVASQRKSSRTLRYATWLHFPESQFARRHFFATATSIMNIFSFRRRWFAVCVSTRNTACMYTCLVRYHSELNKRSLFSAPRPFISLAPSRLRRPASSSLPPLPSREFRPGFIISYVAQHLLRQVRALNSALAVVRSDPPRLV